MNVDEDTAAPAILGARLRDLRRQLQLTLQEVKHASDGEFKASVVGAHERGDRAMSIRRLQPLPASTGCPSRTWFPTRKVTWPPRSIAR